MMDVAVSYNRYKFLGCEFLTWLWYMMENEPDAMTPKEGPSITLSIGNRVVLENRVNDGVETITIKGDAAGLEEGLLSLRKGALVTQLHLVYTDGTYEWRFTAKGESLDLANFTTPETGKVEIKADLEGAIIEKIALYEKVYQALDGLFALFMKERLSNAWQELRIPRIRKWLKGTPAA